MSMIEMKTDKEIFEAKLDAELRETNARLELLRAKIALMSIDLRETISHELSRLTMHKSVVAEKLAQIRGMGEVGWQKVCDGLDMTRRELADGLESLAIRMR
jgi:hypothetical protein